MKKLILSVAVLVGALSLSPDKALAFCSDYIAPEYQQAANFLFEDGVLKGYPDGSCKLGNGINRAETVTFILRNAYGSGDVETTPVTRGWNDISQQNLTKEWFGPFISKGAELGIIKGDSSGNLRPADGVIEAEALVMSMRSAYGEIPNSSNGQWYAPYYDVMRQAGFDFLSNPSKKASRGDVVRIIHEINAHYHEIQSLVENYNSGSVNEPYYPPTVAPTSIPTSAPVYPTNTGRVSWRELVENLENLSSAQVAATLRNLNDTERLQLGIYGAYANLLHVIACDSDPNLVLDLGSYSGPQTCASVVQQWSQTLQFSGGNVQQAFDYALSQRNTLLIGLKCSSGEIDAGSCGTYGSAVQQYNAMNNQNALRIITNMSDNGCLQGDPGCIVY